MFSAVDRLRTLQVCDVMVRDVFTVSTKQAMGEVAAQLIASEISSAPVVDEDGSCIGMLSAVDYVKRVSDRMAAGPSASPTPSQTMLFNFAADNTVEHYMTTGVQSISAQATLLEAARMMNLAHVHHLPVLDGGRVVGMVSTMDIVATLLNAVDEETARSFTS